MKTKSHFYSIAVLLAVILLSSCGILGKKNKSGGQLTNDGQLHGVAPGNKYVLPKPPGMVYIPQGTFHMGPSDEDVAYAFSARNRAVSISGFWMDATEITNNEYRQFVWWVRDSVVAKKLGKVKPSKEGEEMVDWNFMKTFKWNDPKNIELLGQADMLVLPEDRIFGRKELDPNKIQYLTEKFDLKEAAKRENIGVPRSKFIMRDTVAAYPDILVWIRDFAYS